MKEYKEGEKAFWHGDGFFSCPYPMMTLEYTSWNLGWLYAQSVSFMREDEIECD